MPEVPLFGKWRVFHQGNNKSYVAARYTAFLQFFLVISIINCIQVLWVGPCIILLFTDSAAGYRVCGNILPKDIRHAL